MDVDPDAADALLEESQAQQDGGDVKDVQASTASMLRIRAEAATDERHCGHQCLCLLRQTGMAVMGFS